MNSYKEAYKMFFATLANDTRLSIIQTLRKKPLNVSEIVAKTNFEQSLISHNLKVLEYHGMVFKEKKGKFRYYSVNEKTIIPLLAMIDQHTQKYCCRILEGKL